MLVPDCHRTSPLDDCDVWQEKPALAPHPGVREGEAGYEAAAGLPMAQLCPMVWQEPADELQGG